MFMQPPCGRHLSQRPPKGLGYFAVRRQGARSPSSSGWVTLAGHLDADQAHSMQVPVNAVLQILSDPQPLKYAGELVRAADLVAPA
jgi:hypothetical protein